MPINPKSYNVSIREINHDGENVFESRVQEFPDLVEFADSADEAYMLALDSVETTAEIFEDLGKAFPAPHIPIDEFSGRVTLRLPKTLHKAISDIARIEGVSLNQHIVSVLSEHVGRSEERSKYKIFEHYILPAPSLSSLTSGSFAVKPGNLSTTERKKTTIEKKTNKYRDANRKWYQMPQGA